MFVLPPPPRHAQLQPYAHLAVGLPPPPVEASNSLLHPSGPGCEFFSGEGKYVLREELALALPSAHPTETPFLIPNPLATEPQPATVGTRLSLIRLENDSPPLLLRPALSVTPLSLQESPNDGRVSDNDPRSSDSITPSGTGGSFPAEPDAETLNIIAVSSPAQAPAFGNGTAISGSQNGARDVGRRRKPKNNIVKSNSSFFYRVMVHEQLTRRLHSRPGNGLFAFTNIGSGFQWLDFSSPTRSEFLVKLLFSKAHCLCHDVNPLTKSSSHIDVIMGFSTGEIIWWEPMVQRYTRLNKNGIVNHTPVSEIRWIPGSESLFLAAHADGSLIVYDKEKDDSAFSPEYQTAAAAPAEGGSRRQTICVLKSVNAKNQKFNPLAFWSLSQQRINAFAFSPDSRNLAVVYEDGSLRIMDYLKEKLLHIFYSFYGGLSSVCWSPDAKYVLTGGQDDLISIWSMVDCSLVARCQGHRAWVTAVKFDRWHCDGRNYRFGSVGEDCRLCLWDFSVGMLHLPKAGRLTWTESQHSARHRASITSQCTAIHRNDGLLSAPGSVGRTATTNGEYGHGDSQDDNSSVSATHPVESVSQIPILPPVLTTIVDSHPLSWLDFTEGSIMTACIAGQIRTWNRPERYDVTSRHGVVNLSQSGGLEAYFNSRKESSGR